MDKNISYIYILYKHCPHKRTKVDRIFNRKNYCTCVKKDVGEKETFFQICIMILHFYLHFTSKTCNEMRDNRKTSLTLIFNFRCAQQNTHTCMKQSGAKEKRQNMHGMARRKCNIRTCGSFFFFFFFSRDALSCLSHESRA